MLAGRLFAATFHLQPLGFVTHGSFATTTAPMAAPRYHVAVRRHVESTARGFERRSPRGIERVLAEVGRLTDGWAGVGSKAPSLTTIRDLENALTALDREAIAPLIEVDADDGSITAVWQTDDQAFTMMISGNGRVSGTLSPYRQNYLPWTIAVADIEKIAHRLEDATVARLLRGR